MGSLVVTVIRRLVVATLVLVVSACASSGTSTRRTAAATSIPTSTTTTSTTFTTTVPSSTVPTPATPVLTVHPTVPTTAAVRMTLDESAAGTTVTVRPGTQIVVVLHSTYWMFPTKPDPAILMQVGALAYAPTMPCIPGGGCGTVSATFQAVRAGQALISASRTSCGEAMGCTGNQGSFTVTVVISPS